MLASVELIQIVATRARKCRAERGLTQAQFAEQAGLSYKFYQQIESGRKKQIWMETVERIAKGFGLELWQFVRSDELLAASPAVAEEQASFAAGAAKKKRKPARAGKA